MSYGIQIALFDAMERLRARLPYRMELRMNQHTLHRLEKVCRGDIPDPPFAGLSSLVGTPIRIREYMYDNKVGVATYDDKGKITDYEIIEAFK
jgi:hypothetical protein